jgi:hypothetical protein
MSVAALYLTTSPLISRVAPKDKASIRPADENIIVCSQKAEETDDCLVSKQLGRSSTECLGRGEFHMRATKRASIKRPIRRTCRLNLMTRWVAKFLPP